MGYDENRLGSFLVNSFGDRYLHAVNRNAFNAIGSDALYRSLYGEKLFAEYQFNIITGTDSGIFPQFLAKNGIPTGSCYLFIELPEVYEVLSRAHLLDDLPPEICVTTFEAWLEQAKIYHLVEYVFLDAVYLQGSLASSDAHLPDYRDLAWKLSLAVKTTIHNIQSTTNRTMFILRQMENLAENRISFAQTMVGAFAGQTAIILAGGPSLKEALPWVRENKDRVVVIAVSRISRILLDEGIVPHIIVTVDPQQISFEVSREMLRFAEGSEVPLLVGSFHASPLLVGQWPGKYVYTSSQFPWKTPLNADDLRYFGPTVGNYALSIATNLGCKDIVLAGVDLCFTPQGQTHAAGSNENKVGPDLGQISPRIETYGGWHADTNQGYAEALNVLGIQAALASQQGQRVYNCSQGAARIPLVDFISLTDMELQASATTPTELIASRLPEPTAHAFLTHYRLVKTELSRARRRCQEILNLSHEALACADGLFGGNGNERRHKLRMDKIERRLDGNLSDLTIRVRQFGIKKFLTILKTPKQVEDWTDEQVEKATRDYYQAYVAGTEYLIGLLDSTLQRIDSRIEEEKARPDFETLFSQWEKDRQCGRWLVWRQRHPEKAGLMTETERVQAERLEQEFDRVMTEEKTLQINLLERLHDVKHTRSKALLLSRRGEIAELEAMAQGLADHPDQDKSLPYLHFVKGLIAELRGDTDAAICHYQPLLDERHPLTEDALQQISILAISCQDVDNALLALHCLAEMSPAHLPPYGDLLKAVGRFEDAFNAYNRYLGLVPDDAGAMIKLGIFCGEAGLVEAAGELFQKVLAQDANNSAAQMLLASLAIPAPSAPML